MEAVFSVLSTLLLIFLIFLVFRLIMEYVFLFARSYRPTGAVAVVLELAYSVTDPPLKFLRRFIPPLRLGQINLDLSMLVLFILIAVLRSVLATAAA